MMKRNLWLIITSFIILACAAANASTARQSAAVSRKSLLSKQTPVLEIRGGDIVKSSSVAKVATAVSLLQGAVSWLDPSAALEGFGISSSPFAALIMQNLGVILIQMGMVGTCLFFNKNCSTQSALGAASLVSIADALRIVFTRQHKAIGLGKLAPPLTVLAQSAVVAYSNLSTKEYAGIINKINSACLFLTALAFAFAPETLASTVWGVTNLDGKTIGMLSGLGY